MANPHPQIKEICHFGGEIHNMFLEMDKKTAHLSVNSRECYNIRKETLNNILAEIEKGIERWPDSAIVKELKYRCKHSMRIMEMAEAMGAINQP